MDTAEYIKLNNKIEQMSSSGGHTIENASGIALTQRDTLQFKGGLSVSDDSTNDKTEVYLETASAQNLGGVKVGNGLSINANGVLSATGGSGIEWITKEEWDAMTPEQQSTGTYGVQGLGNINLAD